jgi:hypothetical protein
VLSHIETKHAKEVKDVITNPPETGKYECIKKALIQRLSVSQEQQIRQLLEHEEIGDRRPSQFVRHLQTLAGPHMPENVLRTLWIGRLPSNMQAILATRTADKLDEVAEQADKINEVTNRVTTASVQASAAPTLEQQIAQLSKQVAELNKRFTTKENNKKRSRSRSRSRTEEKDTGVCYYHRRFKEKAQKCTQPCTFKKTSTDKKAITEN